MPEQDADLADHAAIRVQTPLPGAHVDEYRSTNDGTSAEEVIIIIIIIITIIIIM